MRHQAGYFQPDRVRSDVNGGKGRHSATVYSQRQARNLMMEGSAESSFRKSSDFELERGKGRTTVHYAAAVRAAGTPSALGFGGGGCEAAFCCSSEIAFSATCNAVPARRNLARLMFCSAATSDDSRTPPNNLSARSVNFSTSCHRPISSCARFSSAIKVFASDESAASSARYRARLAAIRLACSIFSVGGAGFSLGKWSNARFNGSIPFTTISDSARRSRLRSFLTRSTSRDRVSFLDRRAWSSPSTSKSCALWFWRSGIFSSFKNAISTSRSRTLPAFFRNLESSLSSFFLFPLSGANSSTTASRRRLLVRNR